MTVPTRNRCNWREEACECWGFGRSRGPSQTRVKRDRRTYEPERREKPHGRARSDGCMLRAATVSTEPSFACDPEPVEFLDRLIPIQVGDLFL